MLTQGEWGGRTFCWWRALSSGMGCQGWSQRGCQLPARGDLGWDIPSYQSLSPVLLCLLSHIGSSVLSETFLEGQPWRPREGSKHGCGCFPSVGFFPSPWWSHWEQESGPRCSTEPWTTCNSISWQAFKMHIPRPYVKPSESVSLRLGLRICILTEFPGDFYTPNFWIRGLIYCSLHSGNCLVPSRWGDGGERRWCWRKGHSTHWSSNIGPGE